MLLEVQRILSGPAEACFIK